jgi:hypothetical protein
MSIQNQELFNLVRNSKLSQVATPLLKNLRSKSAVPTHQIVFTPKSSAIRSNFGIKTTLPKQIGYSTIIYNDIDNYKNMPDVEKYSGKLYNRLKFQETGLVLKNHFTETNPLFPSETNKSTSKTDDDSITNCFNMHCRVPTSNVRAVLNKNPQLYKQFKKWMVENHPQAVIDTVPQSTMTSLLKQFLNESPDVVKQQFQLNDLAKTNKSVSGSIASRIQGTAGLSYTQKGRLSNTPNGVKYGVVAPGRLVGNKEAAIGGFVANVNDRTTILQHNFARNSPGKHSRQFVMPFKVNEAELTENGSVKLYVDGVKAGTWMQRNVENSSSDKTRYEASHPNFGAASERNKAESENLQRLLNLIIQ